MVLKKIFIFLNLFIVAMPVFGAQTTFNPRFSVVEMITDNIDLTKDNKIDEFIIIPSADLAWAYASPKSSIQFSYGPSYSIYKKYEEYNTFRQTVSVAAIRDFSQRFHFKISDQFQKTEDPISNADDTIRRFRRIYYSNAARADLVYQFGEKKVWQFDLEYSTLENEDPRVDDSEKYRPSMGLTYWFNQNWGTESRLTFESGDFENESNFNQIEAHFKLNRLFTKHFSGHLDYNHLKIEFDNDDKNYSVFNPSLGIDWVIDKDSAFALSCGYYIRNFEGKESQNGFTLNGDLGRTWASRKSSISLTGSSGYYQAYYGSENLGFAQYYELKINGAYLFTRKLGANCYGSHRYAKYEDTDNNRKDRTSGFGCSLNYQLTEWLLGSFAYAHRRVNSTDADSDYTENRFYMIMSVSPATPFKL